MNTQLVNKLRTAQKFATRNRTCPEWRAFKAKWDGKFPTEGTAEYAECKRDSAKAKAAQYRVLREIKQGN